MATLYSVDGGETYQEAPEGIRVIVEGALEDEDNNYLDLHLHATEEGLIYDLLHDDGRVVGTACATYDTLPSFISFLDS